MKKQDNYINKFNHYSPEHSDFSQSPVEADAVFYENLKQQGPATNHIHDKHIFSHTNDMHTNSSLHNNTNSNFHNTSENAGQIHSYHEVDMSDSQKTKNESSSSGIVRGIMIVGILILLFFISLAIVKFVPKAISSLSNASVYLSNIFSKEGISLSASKSTIKPGEVLNLSWKNTFKESGLYTWSFECTEGITVFYNSVDGKQLPVICDTTFPIPEGATSYSFVVNSSKDSNTSFKNTLAFFNKETKDLIATDSLEVTVSKNNNVALKEDDEIKEEVAYTPATSTSIINTNKQVDTSKKTTEKETMPSSKINTPVSTIGKNDLSLTLLEARAIQAGTINLTSLNNVGPYDKVYLRFKVTNNGLYQTGPWRIVADLPTTVISDRNISRVQPSLSPSQTFEMTLIFDAYDSSKREIIISAENTDDTNRSNNILRIPISGNGSSSGGNSTSGTRADLAVKIIDVGVLENNRFISTSNLNQDDTIAVRFEVSNLGTLSSGNYDIKLTVPTDDEEIQYFDNRASLLPGQKSQFTIAIDNPEDGRGSVTIEVDYQNDIRENSESNNETSRSIRID